MTRLSDTRIRILSVLARHSYERDGASDARWIAELCGESHRASDWAHGPLRGMERQGLVEPLGITFRNSRTWRITDAGRQALAAALAGKEGSPHA